jgi:hypothetical protein
MDKRLPVVMESRIIRKCVTMRTPIVTMGVAIARWILGGLVKTNTCITIILVVLVPIKISI